MSLAAEPLVSCRQVARAVGGLLAQAAMAVPDAHDPWATHRNTAAHALVRKLLPALPSGIPTLVALVCCLLLLPAAQPCNARTNAEIS